MFHSGFSGARQALSAILLNSSESLPRADRDGARGLLLPSQPTCCHSAPREGSAPSPIRPGLQAPYYSALSLLTPDLCSAGRVAAPPPTAPHSGLVKRPPLPVRVGAFLQNSALGTRQSPHQHLLWAWSALWGSQGGLGPGPVLKEHSV